MELIGNIITFLNGYIWSTPLIILIVGCSLYFTIRLRFVQVRLIKDMLKNILGGKSSDSGISSLSAFWVALSTRIGTGSIAGVAMAIYMGGPGAVFWMWITTILLSTTSLVECTLGQLYKVRIDDEYRGGAAYCAVGAKNWKWFGVLFAGVTAFTVTLLVPAIQSNMISEAMYNGLNIPPLYTGVTLGIVLGIIVLGGIKRIGKVSNFLIPLKVFGYFGLVIIVLGFNFTEIPKVLSWIFTSAFNGTAAFGGMMGSAFAWGVRRATFSTGAGLGEQTPAAAAAESSHPIKEGLSNAFGIYINLLVCTCTALMILVTDCFNTVNGYIGSGSASMAGLFETDQYGVAFAQEAVNTFIPGAGRILIGIFVFLFAFTCVISYAYYAETSLVYLLGKKSERFRKSTILIARILLVGSYMFFSVATSEVAWNAADLGNGLMAWLNIFLIFILFKDVVKLLKDYEAQKKAGKDPYLDPAKVDIKNIDLWADINKERITAENAKNII